MKARIAQKSIVVIFAAIGLLATLDASWSYYEDQGKIYTVVKTEWYGDGKATLMDDLDGNGALYAVRWQVTLREERGYALRSLTIRDGVQKKNPLRVGDRVSIGVLGIPQRL